MLDGKLARVWSLKRFFTTRESIGRAPLQVLGRLLETLALDAPECGPGERAKFRRDLRALIEEFEPTTTPEAVLLLGEDAVETIRQYGACVQRLLANRQRELDVIIRMMSKTMGEIAGAGTIAANNLKSIEQGLMLACQVGELRTQKEQLKECLTALREETVRQKKHADQMATMLASTFHKDAVAPPSSRQSQVASEPDFEGKSDLAGARRYLEEAHASYRSLYVVLFRFEGLDKGKSRPNSHTRDSILTQFTDVISERLRPGDRVFRWRESSLVAALERTAGTAEVRNEVGGIAGRRFECSISSGNRDVLVTVHISFSIERLDLSRSFVDTIAWLDEADR